MKKTITYKERASFYNSELAVDDNFEDFLLSLKKLYNLKNVMLIPCGAGKYKDIYARVFDRSYFVDCQEEMISRLKVESNHTNIIPLLGNLKNEIDINVDAVFVLNQGMQFLSHNEFRKFLYNYSKHTKYFILDLFDFFKSGNDSLNYYNVLKDEIVSTFYHEGKEIKRSITYRRCKHKVRFLYMYDFGCQTKFELYNYKYEGTIQILNTIPNLIVKNIYTDYLMHFYNDSNRFILILEVI